MTKSIKPAIFIVFVLILAQSHFCFAQQPRPNILFLLVDDMGWKDLGYQGSSFYETPNIDALAKDGMIFNRAYAACPVCSPTRASIMTGKYPVRTGITDFIGPQTQRNWTKNTKLLPADYTRQLDLKEVTIGEALKQGGYKTFFAGKWHLGPQGYWPENQGFDINIGGVDKGSPGKGGYFSPYKNERLKDGPDGEYLPERLSEETAQYIRSQKGSKQPFFIYHSFYLVHSPFDAQKALVKKYQRKRDSLHISDQFGEIGKDVYDNNKMRKVRLNQGYPEYAAMVEALDQAVGRIIKALKDEGLYDKTLIIFTSDNGGLSTSEGTPTSNMPLKGGKGWAYEGGIREPLIVRWPGVTKNGSSSAAVINSTDYYPTLLEAANLPLLPRQHLDGMSFTSLLKGKPQTKERTLFWHYPHYGNQGGSPFSSIMEGDFKLIKYYEDGVYYELYNVKEDIGEKTNLIGRYHEKVKIMKTKLEAFLKESGARYPVANPGYKLGK